MYDPWSARRMPIARSAVSLPDDGPVQTITSLRISPVVGFDFRRGWHWGSGVAVVCAVVVGGGCGCGGGVTYYLEKNDNFACHVTFARQKSVIFEKRTQKYKNFFLHSKVQK
jgi:hypothetical protein